MVQVHQNQIGGEGRPALSGAVFEVSAPWGRADEAGSSGTSGPRKPRTRPLGSWPRSGAADVSAAIGSARASGAAWSGDDPARRREILAKAARALALDPDPGGLLAARLGLESSELAPHLHAIAGALERALLDPTAAFALPRAAEPGFLVLAPAWSELAAPVAAVLFSALALGRTVLYVSDPHAPMIGDALATALERAGLPKGVLSVVHDDGEDALRAALQSGAASYVRASGYPNRIRRLERLAAGGNGAEFGSGLSRSSTAAPGPALEMRILRSKTAVVRSAEDPAARAAEIVEGAFGRSASLSGQLPGQIGRVACSDRSFSKFTELLLAELRKSPDVSRPAPIVERESEDRLRRVRVLGLDEGATLIFDGEDVDGGEQLIKEGAGETAPAASPRSQADAMLAPMVFTNVEERMRLTLLGRPLPLLCLLRVHDDAQGQALAERLDRDVPAEDLTLDAPT